MILKGKCRANGGQLATYLLSSKNEEVRVLDLRGTVNDSRDANGLRQSLRDMDELGKMTRATASLFHLAINPNDRDQMTGEDWQYSVAKVEQALGLAEHPRAVVSHLFQGKEHLHVVWSRVDVETRTCAEMSFSHRKLGKTAREIEIELGLILTPERGPNRVKQASRDVEHHQKQRGAQPSGHRKAIVEAAWHQADSGQDFQRRIERAGYQLALGQRGVLLVDAQGEAFSISRCISGVKARDVKNKMGEVQNLPTLEDARITGTKTLSPQRARTTTGQEFQQMLDVPKPSNRPPFLPPL